MIIIITICCSDNCLEAIQHCQKVAQKYLTEGLRNTPSEVLQEAAILEFAANSLLGNGDSILDSSMVI